MLRSTILACAVVSVVASASAQLVVGTRTSVAGQAGAYSINLTTLSATPLWAQVSNHRPNGLAADSVTGKLYSLDSARLSYNYYGASNLSLTPTFVSSNGGTFRSNGTTNTATGVDDICMANGSLYGWTNFGSTVYSDGIYSIVPSGPFAGLMQPLWTCPDDTYDFEGLAFNPADGLFYGSNTSSSPSTKARGIYTIDALNDPNAVPQLIAAADTTFGATSWDGLAIGDGSIYLTQFVNGTLADNSDDRLYISKYNMTTHVYDDWFQLSIPSNSQVGSGATWAPTLFTPVPEPTTVGLSAAGLMAFARRRRG